MSCLSGPWDGVSLHAAGAVVLDANFLRPGSEATSVQESWTGELFVVPSLHLRVRSRRSHEAPGGQGHQSLTWTLRHSGLVNSISRCSFPCGDPLHLSPLPLPTSFAGGCPQFHSEDLHILQRNWVTCAQKPARPHLKG